MDKSFKNQSKSKPSSDTDDLLERATLFQLMAEATSEAVVIHDFKSVIAANSSFYRLFGGNPSEPIDKSPFSFIAVSHRHALERNARSGDENALECLGIRSDGTTFPIQLSGRSIDYNGAPARIVSVRDLTEQKAAEASLKESEERFRVTFEQAAVGMAHVAMDGSWLRVNQSLCEMLGYAREELLKITFQDVTHPEDLQADLAYLKDVLSGARQHYEMEKRYFRKDGGVIWVNLTVSLLRPLPPQSPYFISIVEDITARKKIEETLRQSQKMDVIGQLTSGIAHDFGNFLNIIKGNLELIQLYQKDSKLLEYGASALSGTDLAEKLIRQLLSLSRNEEIKTESVDINELILKIEPLLRRAVNHKIDLQIELDSGPFIALGERGQLETALLNLVLNARNAMPDGGSISVKTTVAAPATIESGTGNAAFCLIEVKDNGRGMPKHIAARACDPFFTTKATGKGSGLGLSQVLRCVEQMNGFLHIDSEEGVGTTIALKIPCR